MRNHQICGGAALAIGLSLLASCECFYSPMEELIQNDSAVVSAPANVGAFAAGVIGVPVAVVVLPVTVPIACELDANLLPLAPVFAFAQVGAVLFGGLPWLVFG